MASRKTQEKVKARISLAKRISLMKAWRASAQNPALIAKWEAAIVEAESEFGMLAEVNAATEAGKVAAPKAPAALSARTVAKRQPKAKAADTARKVTTPAPVVKEPVKRVRTKETVKAELTAILQ